MSVYLEDFPPARSQYHKVRRVPRWASGRTVTAIVLHTAQNGNRLVLPDTSAPRVASFIATRRDAAGSYASVVDASQVVRVGRYEWEMFHEGTGGNRFSLGLSFACMTVHWRLASAEWVAAILAQGAKEFNEMRRWVFETYGTFIPLTLLTKIDYHAGKPGFTTHARLDPGRRSDPGSDFPMTMFIEAVALDFLNDSDPRLPKETPMAMTAAEMKPYVIRVQEASTRAGFPLTADGLAGERTAKAIEGLALGFKQRGEELRTAAANVARHLERIDEAQRGIEKLEGDVATAEAEIERLSALLAERPPVVIKPPTVNDAKAAKWDTLRDLLGALINDDAS